MLLREDKIFEVMGETSLLRMMGRKTGQYSPCSVSIHKNLPEVMKKFFL
jgi:hypothetical protein